MPPLHTPSNRTYGKGAANSLHMPSNRTYGKGAANRGGAIAAVWALPGEVKAGVGMLFFAYGGASQIETFLTEAAAAARSIRIYNPKLNIAIVTNNETVDRFIFTHHIQPRGDLLFAGSPCPDVCRPDKLPRQWTTRLYYMALSPFLITVRASLISMLDWVSEDIRADHPSPPVSVRLLTQDACVASLQWALDSNTYQCPGPFAHGAIHRFLLEAERTALWGYDIAHANQETRNIHKHNMMTPHCFDLMWRWSDRTSNVFRDWFMIQLRRGISHNDQDPLRVAEIRQKTVGGLEVGQVPTEFAGALYSPATNSNGKFWPRISRTLSGPAQIVHATPLVNKLTTRQHNSGDAVCSSFNGPRHEFVNVKRQVAKQSHSGKLIRVLDDTTCRRVFNVSLAAHKWNGCPLDGGGMRDPKADGELLPVRLLSISALRLDY